VKAGDPQRWRQVRALVGELIEATPEERAARLAGLEPGIAAEVRELLVAGDAAQSGPLAAAVEQGAAGWLAAQATAGEPAAAELVGVQVGAWRIERPLGRGGMAEVWEASRADGHFEHRVAVKLLKRGMDSEEIVARFRRERQILARLEHPAIARLLDGGVAPDGRPFLVLEKVDGEPITDWCRRRNLPVAERLRLLVEAGRAVAAAHRQLVVHRDLKPSNLLVTGDGQVKLLDFGIAKLLAADDPAAGSATRLEQRVLTPAYAAPEQILGEPVSTATDVYSLGVLAYELLVGRLPHRREARDVVDLAGQVGTESIEPPSTAVLAAPPRGTAPAGDDRRQRRRWARQLAGDLDTVLLTALRREPARRYPSVDALVEDLERYLDGRPILARRDSLGYRARKFLGRHRAGVTAAALVLLALVAGLAATAWQAEKARRSAAEAETNARRAQRVKEFLIGLFEVADPEQSGGAAVTAAELLDQAGRRLPQELAGEPGVQAELLETVARIERGLGRLEPAARLAERALALRESAGAAAGRGSALATLGSVRLAQGRLDEAATQLTESLELLGGDDLAAARARSDLAQVSFWHERLDEARSLETEAWQAYRRAFGDEHVLTAIHLRNLAVIDYQQGRYAAAEPRMLAAQQVLERQLGADHATLAQSFVDLAALYDSLDRPAAAEPLYRRALEVRRQRLGNAHPATGQSLQLLGAFLLGEARWDEAEIASREALAIFRAIDPQHFEVAKAIHGLGKVAAGRRRHAEAEAHFSDAVARFRVALGEDHPFVWVATGDLAQQIARQGRLAEAEPLLREAYARLEARSGSAHEYTADAANRLGELLRQRGAASEAVGLHRAALAVWLGQVDERHRKVAESRYQLAASLVAAGLPAGEEVAAALALCRELDASDRRIAELERWATANEVSERGR
jgi:serine/threonine-protein kinase